MNTSGSAARRRVGVVVMAHGTPARLEDVGTFYTEIRRRSPPSAAQLAELESRYRAIGGTSPLNAITRAQTQGVGTVLDARRPGRYVVRHGARFAPPRIEDAVDELAGTGVEGLVGIVLAPHSSHASVREYGRRLEAAAAAAARRTGHRLAVTMVDHWYDVPGFAELVGNRVQTALASLPADCRGEAVVLFTAHSVPTALIDAGDTYPDQVAESAAAVAEAAGLRHWSVAWQSGGRTEERWLGPDVGEEILERAAAGTTAAVVCPIGFVSDHLEVLYDLDIEARAVADKGGLLFARTMSFNDDPAFCAVVAQAVLDADDRQ